jgi:Glycosyl hydrolase family 1
VTTRRTSGDWSPAGPFRFAVGIEDTFIAHEAPGRRRLDEYELTQHYQFWREDLDLVARSGADSLRWGIPWYLVEPEPGRFAWDWTDLVVGRMAELGLVCIVDLMHYGTPLWLENSFLHPDYPKLVAEYAAAAADRYRDLLHVWTPLNEPIVNAIYCGEKGLWPPYLVGQHGFTAVLAQLAEGICRTQASICDIPEARLAWLRDHAVVPDVVGVNYYPAFTTVRYDAGEAHPVEGGTAGLADLLRLYNRRYQRPVMVTETSRAGTVEDRRAWLRDSLACVAALRTGGMPLVGYTWFPFTALVDWLYRESCAPVDEWLVQMGQVDLARIPGGGALERQPTQLLEDFAQACRRGMPPVKA